MRLDQQLVTAHIEEFLGYGNPKARWWFVGMEEKGSPDFLEAERRLNAWHDLGPNPFVDLTTFLDAAGLESPHRNKPLDWRDYCTAWKRQVHILLSAQGLPCKDKEIVDCFDQWGAESGQTALIDLKPLPCPDWNTWLWPQWCDVESSKEAFLARIEAARCRKIADAIKASSPPRCVVFYGASLKRHWLQIADCELNPVVQTGILSAKTNGTVFVVVPQRRKQGISYELMEEVGPWVKNELAA